MSDHDHRGEYASDNHDHYDYAEKYHRHYDDESIARGLREDLGRAEARISDLENELDAVRTRLSVIEERLHDHEMTVPHAEPSS